MRTHSQIVVDAGVPRIAEAIPSVSIHTIRSWGQRNSIPGEHWDGLAEAGIATLAELAKAAAIRAGQMSADAA